MSLWDALRSLQGRWLSPDPLLLYVEQSGGVAGEPRGELPGLEEVVALERTRAEPPPGPGSIRAALKERLVPEPVYRVVWSREASHDSRREAASGEPAPQRDAAHVRMEGMDSREREVER